MKKRILHITSLLMVVVILTATLQVSLTKMTCLMSGKVVYSLTDAENCAPIQAGDNVGKKCCDFHKITFDYNTLSTISDFDCHLLKITTFMEVYLPKQFFAKLKSTPLLTFFHNLPPPLSGMDLLKTIEVYRL